MRLPVVDLSLNDHGTASDKVTAELRRAIVTGQFADGEGLNQVELAQHFRVSRAPIREAVRRLEAEGLVRAKAHRRAVVVGQSVERIQEIFEIRRLVEVELLGRAASSMDEEAIAELDAHLDNMEAEAEHEAWRAGNEAFHRAMYDRAGWAIASELVERLRYRVERYVRGAGGLVRNEEANREHRRIVAALRDGDVETAKAALGEHIARTFEGIRHVAKGSGGLGTDDADPR
jgi:DNA-binding GntR family transcriptional regulator